jgi:hypothetical protein
MLSSRIRDRLKRLEDGLTPKERRILVLFAAEGAPHVEPLDQFRAENRVGPQDFLVTVTFDA